MWIWKAVNTKHSDVLHLTVFAFPQWNPLLLKSVTVIDYVVSLGNGYSTNKRKNTAKILLGFTVLFLISYAPCHILEIYFYSSIIFYFSSFKFIVLFFRDHNLGTIFFILLNLLSINYFLSPVALFCTSLVFRRQFKRYLTCCCKTNSPPDDFKLTKITVFNIKPVIPIHPSTLYDTQHLFIRIFIIYSMTSGCYYSF